MYLVLITFKDKERKQLPFDNVDSYGVPTIASPTYYITTKDENGEETYRYYPADGVLEFVVKEKK